MKSKIAVLYLVVILLTVSGFAHHGPGLWEPTVSKSIQGTVKSWRFVNPHPVLLIDVKDGTGKVTTWYTEFHNPSRMSRSLGWNRKTFQPGDQITVTGHPWRDGRPILYPATVKFANGQEVDADFNVAVEVQSYRGAPKPPPAPPAKD